MPGLDIACMRAIFDHSSRSGDIVGAYQSLNGSRDLTTHLSGIICHPWASICWNQSIYCAAHSSLTYHDLAPFVLNVTVTSHRFILPLVVCLKALLSALYALLFIMYTTSLSTLSLPYPSTITFVQMTLSSFNSFHPLNFDSSISRLQNALQQMSS